MTLSLPFGAMTSLVGFESNFKTILKHTVRSATGDSSAIPRDKAIVLKDSAILILVSAVIQDIASNYNLREYAYSSAVCVLSMPPIPLMAKVRRHPVSSSRSWDLLGRIAFAGSEDGIEADAARVSASHYNEV